ncbi:MarR family winged helix-turn-helix transcriptional regulator [Lysinibacter cavernae]|uniref:DNA-binding MarR family transcriptional regulator n=1 Tax=Lysinibacter cavernae TaxID=1640652 RepID=A0A7X5TSH9_9MICO|nr:MarR family transcriptional regulator [Lysinibacter cavernae]NIH53541.1 DNA-binding MarR family transcriptional regulator [Lysinibacter cavernae]
MQTQPEDSPAARQSVRPQSLQLRALVELSGEFEKHLARQLTVNATDLEAMEHLIQAGPLSPTEIARRLDISTAAVTSAIDRLSTLGHVDRTPNPDDRRGVIVAATPGSAAKAMSVLLPMIYAVDAVLDEFDSNEQAVIGRYLERVSEEYSAHIGE